MYYWIRSMRVTPESVSVPGRAFPGSGQAEKVLEEAGVHARPDQGISDYAEAIAKR